MKKIILFTLIILSANVTNAQVGIGTTNPHKSSILDITSASSGVLFPRVALSSSTDNTTISNAEISLFVYNTNTVNDLTAGFYFWNGNKWVSIMGDEANEDSGANDAWSLEGNNLNSVSGTKFIGTTTYHALNLKVNDLPMGSLHPNGGISFGIGASVNVNRSIAIGQNANSSSSVEATAIGANASASGYQSLSIGTEAKSTNNNALALSTFSVASGLNSVALGSKSNATAQNAVAIGPNSKASQSNAIVLGDISNANVGIGTSTPNTTTKLDVNGKYKLGSAGSVHKSIISFDNYPSISMANVVSGGSQVITINIPSDYRPSTTKATVVVTPDNNFDDDFSISWAKLQNTSKLRIKIINSSTTTQSLYSGHFYITINEF